MAPVRGRRIAWPSSPAACSAGSPPATLAPLAQDTDTLRLDTSDTARALVSALPRVGGSILLYVSVTQWASWQITGDVVVGADYHDLPVRLLAVAGGADPAPTGNVVLYFSTLPLGLGAATHGAPGPQGRFPLRQYRNATAKPSGGGAASYNLDTGAFVPSTGWYAPADLPTPGAGESTWFQEADIDPAQHSGTITPDFSVVLVAGGTGPAGPAGAQGGAGLSQWPQYSADGSTWLNAPPTGTRYIRFGAGITRPASTSAVWQTAIDLQGPAGPQGPPGLVRLRQYRNASAKPGGGGAASYNVGTRAFTPSAGWSKIGDLPTPNTGEETWYQEVEVNPAQASGTVAIAAGDWSVVLEAAVSDEGIASSGKLGRYPANPQAIAAARLGAYQLLSRYTNAAYDTRHGVPGVLPAGQWSYTTVGGVVSLYLALTADDAPDAPALFSEDRGGVLTLHDPAQADAGVRDRLSGALTTVTHLGSESWLLRFTSTISRSIVPGTAFLVRLASQVTTALAQEREARQQGDTTQAQALATHAADPDAHHPAGSGGEGGGADATARTAAAAAQLAADTIVEIGPAFLVNESTQRNLYVNLQHPLNAYPDANIISVSVAGSAPNLQAYDPAQLQRTYVVGLTTSEMNNIASQGIFALGNYVLVDVRLRDGRNGPTHFFRNVYVPVVAAPDGVPRRFEQMLSTSATAATLRAGAYELAMLVDTDDRTAHTLHVGERILLAHLPAPPATRRVVFRGDGADMGVFLLSYNPTTRALTYSKVTSGQPRSTGNAELTAITAIGAA